MESTVNTKRQDISHGMPPPNKWAVLVTVMFGLFMVVLDFNIVTVALPAMMRSFRASEETVKLVVESYALSYAVFTLTGSWLRERIGIRPTFLAGLVIFTAASLLCGLSWALPSMIAFRIIKGLGGGIMMPTGFTMMTESFPPNERGKAFGIFGMVIVFAPSIGPTLGGYLVDFLDWRFVFFINIPIGALVFALASRIMRDTRPLAPCRFDLAGFLSLGFSLACILAALNLVRGLGWTHSLNLVLFAVSAAAFAVFLVSAARADCPIIQLNLFRNFHFSVLSFLNFYRAFIMFARIVLLPMMFQSVLGLSAFRTGLLLMPGAIASGLTMPAIGPFIDRYGPRWFIFWGFIIQAAGSFMFYNIGPGTDTGYIVASMIIFGVGAGLLGTPVTSAAMNAAPRRYIGQVSIVLTVIMQVGQAFGVAVFGTTTVLRAAAHAHGAAAIPQAAWLAGYREAFIAMGVLSLLGLIPALGTFGIRPAPGNHHAQESLSVAAD